MTEKTLRLNKIEEKVKTYLRQKLLVSSGMHVCVCFSGGMDSSVLLRILYRLRDLLEIKVSACHFNHMIRGEEADRDEAFCRQTCDRLGIPFFCGRADVVALYKQSGRSLEETARDARYAWFSELAKRQGIDCMATAHHKNDQTETVLFRLIRGTTVSGLAGIPFQRDLFVRPLLCLSKKEIVAYANECGIEYQTDSTNRSELYTRNYIRHTVIPSLERINPSVTNAVVRLSEYASDDDAFILSMLPSYEAFQDLNGQPMPIIRRTVARNFAVFSGKTLCYQHLDEISEALCAKNDKRIGLPDGMTAVVKDGRLCFEETSGVSVPEIECGVLTEGVTDCCENRVRVTFCRKDSDLLRQICSQNDAHKEIVYNLSTEIPLSCEKICGMIQYRPRLQGDRLILHGVSRSVKKLFSEQKIPIHLRKMIPVFFDDQGILCIPFVAVSDRVYSTFENAKYILRVEVIDTHTRKVVEDS